MERKSDKEHGIIKPAIIFPFSLPSTIEKAKIQNMISKIIIIERVILPIFFDITLIWR
jgi:hypothetical protein